VARGSRTSAPGTPPLLRGPASTYVDDLNQVLETTKILRIERVERQVMGERGRRDHQVDGICTAGFATNALDCCVDVSVRLGALGVEGERPDTCFDLAQMPLTPPALDLVVRRVWAPSKLGDGQR